MLAQRTHFDYNIYNIIILSCLGYHCLCTSMFVIILMFKVLQIGIDLTLILCIQKHTCMEVKQDILSITYSEMFHLFNLSHSEQLNIMFM